MMNYLQKAKQKFQVQRLFSKLRETEQLRPIDTEAGRRDVAIGFLTCNRHFPLMLLAAKSFYHFSGVVCPLYVWDDGSLRSDDYVSLRRLFPNAHILRSAELDFSVLERHPLTLQFAQRKLKNYEAYAPALKLLGPLMSPHAPQRFILSDSDAFFFDWPQALIDWLHDESMTNRYIAPMSGQDNVSESELQDLYNQLQIHSCPRINSGLLLLHRTLFDLDIVEKVLRWYKDRPYAWDIEQTMYRILMACSKSIPLNQDEYVLCHRKYNAVCHHFFTSVIEDEEVVQGKLLNLLEYVRDCERRAKPPVIAAQQHFDMAPTLMPEVRQS